MTPNVTALLGYGLEMLADQQMIVPRDNHNRPGTKTPQELGSWPAKMRGGVPDEIVVHDTANTAPGADAIMHGRFLANGGGAESVSFHAGADDKRVVQYLPWDETCYAAGDGLGVGNTDSINLECCVNRDGDFAAMLLRAAVFIAKLMRRFSIPLERVRQHNYRSSYHKDCPHSIRSMPGGWDKFLSMVKEAYDKMTPTPTPQLSPVLFPETGKSVAPDFYHFWVEHGGVPVFGYPIRDETNATRFDGLVIRVQSFERARLERHPDGIKLGLVEAERLKLLGQ
jgi:hypothetical protein